MEQEHEMKSGVTNETPRWKARASPQRWFVTLYRPPMHAVECILLFYNEHFVLLIRRCSCSSIHALQAFTVCICVFQRLLGPLTIIDIGFLHEKPETVTAFSAPAIREMAVRGSTKLSSGTRRVTQSIPDRRTLLVDSLLFCLDKPGWL